jgi:hypothetical protein
VVSVESVHVEFFDILMGKKTEHIPKKSTDALQNTNAG